MTKKILAEFSKKRSGLLNVPLIVIDGKVITVKQFLLGASKNQVIKEKTAFLKQDNISEDLFLLTEEYYKQQMKKPPPILILHILWLGKTIELTPKDCLEEVKNRTPLGEALVRTYRNFLKQIWKWIEDAYR